MDDLRERIFAIRCESEFESLCMEVFHLQYHNNKVYKQWCDLLGKNADVVKCIDDIPFLPIGFFRTHKVVAFSEEPAGFFRSSGTTSESKSTHWIRDFGIYERSFTLAFEQFFSKAEDYCIVAMLPHYQQQGNSSLIYMIEGLIKQSSYSASGFYPFDLEKVRDVLTENEKNGTPTILFGVSYALLDLAERYSFDLKHTLVFETGGMKGRRKEMSKKELHSVLCKAFGVKSIASEYGMCELFSQAYSKSEGVFYSPSWLKVVIRETTDPFENCPLGKTGIINLIDLANIDTCSFIASEDLGRMQSDGGFEVLGRAYKSVVKGCNLMYEQAIEGFLPHFEKKL